MRESSRTVQSIRDNEITTSNFLTNDYHRKGFVLAECKICHRMFLRSKFHKENVVCDDCGSIFDEIWKTVSVIRRKRSSMMKRGTLRCEYCGDIIDKSKLGVYASGRFCSKEHALLYASSISRKKTHVVKCMSCGTDVTVSINVKNTRCETCKKTHERERLESYQRDAKQRTITKCRTCGCEFGHCRRPDTCQHYRLIDKMIRFFDFDKSLLGSEGVISEWDRVTGLIRKMYYDEKMSMCDIAHSVGYKDAGNFAKFLKHFITPRRLKDAINLALLTKIGRTSLPTIDSKTKYQYKHGIHTSWNGVDVYYRSSYELDMCEILDTDRRAYFMETMRIPYYDTQQMRRRVSVPDFYLPDENLLIEVKSRFTFDKINLLDRYVEYIARGFNFQLEYEHVTYPDSKFLLI